MVAGAGAYASLHQQQCKEKLAPIFGHLYNSIVVRCADAVVQHKGCRLTPPQQTKG